MKIKLLLGLLMCLHSFTAIFAQVKPSKNRQTIIQSIETHQAELIKISDQIWTFAETALAENQSAKLLADYAESRL